MMRETELVTSSPTRAVLLLLLFPHAILLFNGLMNKEKKDGIITPEITPHILHADLLNF